MHFERRFARIYNPTVRTDRKKVFYTTNHRLGDFWQFPKGKKTSLRGLDVSARYIGQSSHSYEAWVTFWWWASGRWGVVTRRLFLLFVFVKWKQRDASVRLILVPVSPSNRRLMSDFFIENCKAQLRSVFFKVIYFEHMHHPGLSACTGSPCEEARAERVWPVGYSTTCTMLVPCSYDDSNSSWPKTFPVLWFVSSLWQLRLFSSPFEVNRGLRLHFLWSSMKTIFFPSTHSMSEMFKGIFTISVQ